MNIELTPSQSNEIGDTWFTEQIRRQPAAVLRRFFSKLNGMHFSWLEMLSLSVDECAKNFFVPRKSILQDLGFDPNEPALLVLQELVAATDEMNEAGPENPDRRVLAQARLIEAWKQVRALVDDTSTD